MELSLYTTYLLGQDFPSYKEAFSHFYKKGVRYGDIVDCDIEKYPLEEYCRDLKEAGIVPGSLVCMANIASFDKEKREKQKSLVKGYIDKMEKLSMNLLMPAPAVNPARSEDEFIKMGAIMIESYREITEYAKKKGITVAIENQSTLTRPDSRAEDIRYILDEIPDLGFVFDIGNFFCIGEDALYAYNLLKDRLVHVHAKDWVIDPYGDFVRENMPRFGGCVIGNGVLPVRGIMENLRHDSYPGKVTLEINSKVITLEMLEKSAEFLRSEIYV